MTQLFSVIPAIAPDAELFNDISVLTNLHLEKFCKFLSLIFYDGER